MGRSQIDSLEDAVEHKLEKEMQEINRKIQFCEQHIEHLPEWERGFIEDLAEMDEDMPLSTGPGSQTDVLNTIYEKLV